MKEPSSILGQKKNENILDFIYSNFGIKKIKYEVDPTRMKKNEKKINKLIPEINIKINQVNKIKIDCPISGCITKNNITGNITNRLKI